MLALTAGQHWAKQNSGDWWNELVCVALEYCPKQKSFQKWLSMWSVHYCAKQHSDFTTDYVLSPLLHKQLSHFTNDSVVLSPLLHHTFLPSSTHAPSFLFTFGHNVLKINLVSNHFILSHHLLFSFQSLFFSINTLFSSHFTQNKFYSVFPIFTLR